MPHNRKTAGASATTQSFSEKEWLLKTRAIKRAERAEARRVKAEEHEEAVCSITFPRGALRNRISRTCGETCTFARESTAIAEYEVAIKIHGPTALYLLNMAAAWLKLESYDAAEHCARRALCLDPKFAEARYRRGLARKGNLQLTAAWADFVTVLGQNPDLIQGKKAHDETLVLTKQRNEKDGLAEMEDAAPSLADAKVELESVSDSSDWNHKWNGIPCRDYNHDGCTRGLECTSSHAPDQKSVRDRLGRNVCTHFLLGECRLGGCVYSHDKTHLPSGRWWENEEKRATIRDMSGWTILRQNPASLPRLLSIIDERIAWIPAPAAKKEDACVWKDNIMMLEGFGDATDNLEYAAYTSRGRGSWSDGGRRGSRHGEPGLDNFEENDNWDDINLEEVCQCEGIPGHESDHDAFDVNAYIDAYSL